MKITKTILYILATLCVFFAFSVKAAEVEFDVKKILREPGVKLVIVDFFSPSCKPCVEAIPAWEKLNKKYYKDGLRFIVITTSKNKKCAKLDWTPYKTICDYEGTIQDYYGIKELPQAFLYSWHGKLLAERADVDTIAAAIENFFNYEEYIININKVKVIGHNYAISTNEEKVAQYVDTEFSKQSKFTTINFNKDDVLYSNGNKKCLKGLGKNTYLDITLYGNYDNKRRDLVLKLYNSCGETIASSTQPYKGVGIEEDLDSIEEAVKKGVKELLRKLIILEEPQPFTSKGQGQFAGEKGTITVKEYSKEEEGVNIRNEIVDDKGYLSITSEPSGALIKINGIEKGLTPYETELMIGDYVIICSKGEMYYPARQKIKLTEQGKKIRFELEPRFGELKITSEPVGAEIYIDGEPTGAKTPYSLIKKSGNYKISLLKKGYLNYETQVKVEDGDLKEVRGFMKANHGSITVSSKPSGAMIYLDGINTGLLTPATIKEAQVGLHEVSVVADKYYESKKKAEVKLGKNSTLEFILEDRKGLLKITAEIVDLDQGTPTNAKVYLNDELQDEETPFKKKITIGKYKLELKADGAKNYTQYIDIKEGGTVEVKAKLPKKLAAEIIKEREEMKKKAEKEKKEKEIAEEKKRKQQEAELAEKRRRKKEIEEQTTNHIPNLIIGSVATVVGIGLLVGGMEKNNDSLNLAGWLTIGCGGIALLTSFIFYAISPKMPEDLKNISDNNNFIITPDITPDAKGGMLRLFWEF